MERRLKLTTISSVQTSDSKRKALHVLEEMRWDSLFLRLPTDWERGLEALRIGFNFEQVVDEMRAMDQVRLPEDAHLLTAWRPLLEGLREFGERRVHCLRDPLAFSQERSIALDLASLSLRARLGHIEVREWKELIEEETWLAEQEATLEAERLLKDATGEAVCVDLSQHVEERLRLRGVEIERVIVGTGKLPLETLRTEMMKYQKRGEEMPEALIINRIREHMDFLDRILSRDRFDEAFASWNANRNGS